MRTLAQTELHQVNGADLALWMTFLIPGAVLAYSNGFTAASVLSSAGGMSGLFLACMVPDPLCKRTFLEVMNYTATFTGIGATAGYVAGSAVDYAIAKFNS